MRFFADKMEELDNFFSAKNVSESYMIIVGVAGTIAFVAYMVFLPYSQEEYNVSDENKKTIKKNINKQKEYLDSISSADGDQDYKVKQQNREIASSNSEISNLKAKIKFVNINLEQLSDMLFNKRSWSKFIDSISSKAYENDVIIRDISNEYVDNNGSFGHVLKVGVGCKGDYNSIVRFVNQLEQNVLVTDVYSSHIYSDTDSADALADINISVWGINH
jgi:hypothetical protein